MQKRFAFLMCTILTFSMMASAQMGGDKQRPSPWGERAVQVR